LQEKKAALEAKKTVYENIDSKSQEYHQAEKREKTAQAAAKKCKDALEKADKALWDANEVLNEKNKTAGDYRDSYIAGICGDLAKDLQEGEVCPVCGNTHHPKKAEIREGHVTKEMMDQASQEAKDAGDAWNRANEARGKADEEYRKAQEEASARSGELKAAETAWQLAKEELIEGIADLSALLDRIDDLAENIASWIAKGKALETNLTQCATAQAESKEALNQAIREDAEAQKALKELSEELISQAHALGYDSVEAAEEKMLSEKDRAAIRKEISDHESSVKTNQDYLDQMREDLKGTVEPDSATFAERQAELKRVQETYQKTKLALEQKVHTYEENHKKITKLEEHYQANITEAENDSRFAGVLRGSSGISLQRYVLSIMFNQVIGEANQMLSKIHSGRYQLSITNDKGVGNKRGLELIAHDNRVPDQKGRPVAMLSGGEKFLVSLALSIGMSSVARRSGIRIEALFIDEGFGTLDESSIQDAIDVLEGVRKGNGMIGIISHVKLLEDNIPTHIEILKSDSGSSIKKC
ncbi:MAG: SMC family ATPase, partial [Acetatifactor sp.]|nr:SMC family ATPase [Acetatifactor sp.]